MGGGHKRYDKEEDDGCSAPKKVAANCAVTETNVGPKFKRSLDPCKVMEWALKLRIRWILESAVLHLRKRQNDPEEAA